MYLMKDIKELDRTGRWNPTFQMLHLDTRKEVEDLTTTAAKLPQNRSLNRYRDVLPYDQTRVRLKTGNNDYINANYVEVPKVKRKYILAQGPLPSTSEDFWRMVWENDSKGIIMLNRIVEKNVIKCHPYWPMGEDEELEFGDFAVSNYSCQMRSSFIIRELLLTNSVTNENRLIKQFHFVTWPDFGVPSEPESFLEFLDEIKGSGILDPDAPPIVHCSAGIGRSGTFCLVDAALELAILNNSTDNIDPHQMLLAMRRYRCGLVQTAEQLRFANIAIVYGLYVLFPSIAEKEEHPTELMHEANGDNSDDDDDDDCIPPPLPPRKKKETPSPTKPTHALILEQDQINQVKAYRQINELESSGEGSSDEEILNLSEDSCEDTQNELSENVSSYTKITDKKDDDNNDIDVDEDIIVPRSDTTVTDNNLNIGTKKDSETTELRRRDIHEKKQKTKILVDTIKKNMKENENRIFPVNFWKYAGIAIGIGSLLFLAYQLYS